MGTGFAPTWLKASPPPTASQNHFNHWQSPANYHSYIVFCHVLQKRTLHNVNHQHENIQILQLLLITHIYITVSRAEVRRMTSVNVNDIVSKIYV